MQKFIFRIIFFLYILHIGLLTLFYTGTISIFSIKYFILNDIVKKLKQESMPVGSIFNVTSEILCNKTVVNKENVKPIFEHRAVYLTTLCIKAKLRGLFKVLLKLKALLNKELSSYLQAALPNVSTPISRPLVLYKKIEDIN